MVRTRQEFYWANHSSSDFKSIVTDQTVAVLPVGAIEQHGPHLPVSVDTDINNGIVKATIDRLLDSQSPILFLPIAAIGKSTEHIDFPGTLTLSANTIISMWSDIIDGVAKAGVKRLVIFNSHGGQLGPMDIVSRDARIKHNMLVFCCNWFGLGLPDGLINEHENTYGIHAGELETAMMLHLQPQKCQLDKAQNFKSSIEKLNTDTKHLGLGAGGKLAWKTNDLNLQGACGDASNATAQTGKRAIDFIADRFAEMLAEVSALDLDILA